MPCKKINNNSDLDLGRYKHYLDSFIPYTQKVLGYNKPFVLNFQSDQENSKKALGRTAFYDPNTDEVTIYVDGRHIKDIMRSIAHELVHHTQNCRGEFEGGCAADDGYAQTDSHLRGMEREAYEKGNMLFRDWEDGYKRVYGENIMKTKIKVLREEIEKQKLDEKSIYNPNDPRSDCQKICRKQGMISVDSSKSAGNRCGCIYASKNPTQDMYQNLQSRAKIFGKNVWDGTSSPETKSPSKKINPSDQKDTVDDSPEAVIARKAVEMGKDPVKAVAMFRQKKQPKPAAKKSAARVSRKPNKKMAFLQDMLFQNLNVPIEQRGSKKKFGSGYKTGADGIYGPTTQKFINILRKKYPDAPRRKKDFNASVDALIKFLKSKEGRISEDKKYNFKVKVIEEMKKQQLNEITFDSGNKGIDREVNRILSQPYSQAGYKRLLQLDKKVNGTITMSRHFKNYKAGFKGDTDTIWSDAGKFWAKKGVIEKPDDLGHLILDIVGLIPVAGTAADIANTLWYVKEGRWLHAGFSLLAALPVAGYLAIPLKRAAQLGKPISAGTAKAMAKHMPTFLKAGESLVNSGKGISKASWNKISKAMKEFVETGKDRIPGVVPKKQAIEAAEKTVANVQKQTGRTLQRVARETSEEGFAKVVQKNVGEKGLAGATKLAGEASRTIEKRMADAAEKIPELVKQATIAYKTGRGRKNIGELVRNIMIAGGDEAMVNSILKQVGSNSKLANMVASRMRLTGPAAEEFLKLAQKAQNAPKRIFGKKVSKEFMKKYRVRQFTRAGVKGVEYSIYTHTLDGDKIVDDPLNPPAPIPDNTDGGLSGGGGKGTGKCTNILKIGCKGPNVENLQKKLKELGFDLGPRGVDGDYGRKTAGAVKVLQTKLKDKGVDLGTSGPNRDGVDGVFGPKTRAALEKLDTKKQSDSGSGSKSADDDGIVYTGEQVGRIVKDNLKKIKADMFDRQEKGESNEFNFLYSKILKAIQGELAGKDSKLRMNGKMSLVKISNRVKEMANLLDTLKEPTINEVLAENKKKVLGKKFDDLVKAIKEGK